MTVQDLRVSARTAEIRASSSDGYTFHGVAVGEGDILHTPDGEPVYFGARELKAAADSQEGRPLSLDHPTDENGQSIYPPPTKESPGTVETAKYVEGKGLAYEANTHDEDVAKGIKAGNYEVSVHPKFKLGEFDEEIQAYRPDLDTLRFLDLSVVSEGMSPSNTAQWGPSQEILAWTQDGLEEELTTDSGGSVGGDKQTLIQKTVRATLNAAGIGSDESEVTAGGGEQGGNGEAESSETGDSKMDRDNLIREITAEADIDDEALEQMDDDSLEATHDSVVDDETDDDETVESEDQTLGEMTPQEAVDALSNHGVVTEDNAADLVASASDELDKREKVSEIVAKSDDYGEDDKQDLLASADSLINKEYKRVRGESAAQLPGNAGGVTEVTASSNNSPDDYGTGVSGDN